MATNGECQDGQAPSVHESTTPTGLSPNVDDTTSANSPSVAHPDDSSVAHPKAKLINESWGSCSAGASVTEVFAEEINQNDLHLQVGVQSVQGARKTMEDEHQVINDGGGEKVSFFGVYDGHAGKKAAEFLRDQLHTTLLSHSQVQSEPESALKEAIEEAEVAFLARAKEEKLDDGSTLAVVLIKGNEMITANVGDSEIVLCRGGKPLVLSTAHNMMKNTAEEQRVKDAGGVVFRSRLGHPYINPQLISIAVTRSIGDITFKDTDFTAGRPSGLIASPDTRRITLTTEDEFFLIGCDGLWDVMTHEESVGFVKERLDQGITPQKMSEHIVKEALKRGSKDNITVLVVTLKRLAEASAPAEAPASDTPESSDAAATPANDVEPSA
jgi:serine/threonine protein phosphatase PrpC